MQRIGEAIRQYLPTILSAQSKTPLEVISNWFLFSVSFKYKPTYTVSGKYRASLLQTDERSGTEYLKKKNKIVFYSICNPNYSQQILSFLAHRYHETKEII